MVPLTAARTAVISASALVAIATSGASWAGVAGGLSLATGLFTLQPLATSAAIPAAPAIRDRLATVPSRPSAVRGAGMSTTDEY